MLLLAVALVLAWMIVIAVVAGVSSGYWGDLGLPTDEEGRPRGLLVIGAATLMAGVATAVTYRRISGPVGDLLAAAEQVAAGDYHAHVAERGLHELRVLASTFNDMAARLAVNDEQRRHFLADITHELRNPLAILQTQIEAQLDGIHPRDDRHLTSLLDETRRLGHLVDDLHTLAVLETGRLVLQHEVVALGHLVDEVVERHGSQARQQDVTLVRTIAADVPKVSVDPYRIRQVLDNVVTNAIRHTPPGEQVSVEVAAIPAARPGARAMVRCRVTDAGPGFRDEQLRRVFERFQRAGDSRGSGLGLSIARDLIEAHGGTIDAGNDPTTGGGTVEFTLPT